MAFLVAGNYHVVQMDMQTDVVEWAEAFPIPNKEAATIARVVVEQVMCRFGCPITCISDRGKEVDGNLMREICCLLDVDKLRTTAYHPSCNGCFDRSCN